MKAAFRGMSISKIFLVAILFALAGCAPQEFSSMKTAFQEEGVFKVGVIPFENLTPNIKAGEDLSRYCYNEMFRQLYSDHRNDIGPYRMEMEDEFRLREILHKNKWLDQNAHLEVGLSKMAETLGVDVLLLGTVSEYHYKRGLGEDPVVSLHLRLYDRKHDTIIWSGDYSNVGSFSWFKEDALGRLARQVSSELISRMLTELRDQVTHPISVQK